MVPRCFVFWVNTNGASRRANVLRTWGHGFAVSVNTSSVTAGAVTDFASPASKLAGAKPRPLPLKINPRQAPPTAAKNKPALATFDPRKHRPGNRFCFYNMMHHELRIRNEVLLWRTDYPNSLTCWLKITLSYYTKLFQLLTHWFICCTQNKQRI